MVVYRTFDPKIKVIAQAFGIAGELCLIFWDQNIGFLNKCGI
ncbi:MAG: hypothetical protein CM1200mP1_05210 [Candidatus Neomarinimicrobiota bacterium]|nr:MAG: hypothetical protein CM1200mP1_05210 [Candidatus Neomarinimicrobiota bacterium]